MITDSYSDKIEDWLNKHKINVFTSITRAVDSLNLHLTKNKLTPYYINRNNKLKLDSYNCVVMIDNFYNINSKEMCKISYLLKRFPLLYVDDCAYNPIDNCTEVSNKDLNNVFNNCLDKSELLVPDALAYIELLNPKYKQSFSKITLKVETDGIKIGDSNTDRLFAENNNLIFLDIDIIHKIMKK